MTGRVTGAPRDEPRGLVGRVRREPMLLAIAGFIWAAYLALSGVYWLPFAGVGGLVLAKLLLLLIAFGIIVADAALRRQSPIPMGFLGLAGFFLILSASAPGLFAGTVAGGADDLASLFLGFCTVVVFRLFVRNGGNLGRVLVGGAAVVGILSAVTVLSATLGAPSWTSPYGDQPLWAAGFADQRTGWSNSVSYSFIVLFVAGAQRLEKRTPSRFVLIAIALFAVLPSQYLAGGRAGLLGSVGTIIAVSIWLAKRRRVALPIAILVLAAFLAVPERIEDQLRLTRSGFDVSDFEDLDWLSSDRLSGYEIGWGLLKEEPLTGHGFGVVDLTRDYGHVSPQIHNVWLRLAVDAGPVFVLVLLGWLLALFWVPQARPHAVPAPKRVLISLIFLNGMWLSMLEPQVIVGTFQTSVFWWAALGSGLGYAARRVGQGVRSPSPGSVRRWSTVRRSKPVNSLAEVGPLSKPAVMPEATGR